jgi:ubiquinone/menaquinone biosynthesis C-methylase UbiE
MGASNQADGKPHRQGSQPYGDVRRALAPTDEAIAGMPLRNNAELAGELLAGCGPRVLDVGCGDGTFTRQFAKLHHGRLAGIDIRERKIEEARVAAAAAGVAIEFHNASAEAMPFADDSFDVVMFSNSLHHMADIDLALHEAVRVLAPGGLIYIMEPVPAGSYFEATRSVNDETAVRTAAYHAIGSAIAGGLLPLREERYRSRRRISSFDEWREDQITRDDKRRAAFAAQPEIVRAQFEKHAQQEDGFFVFDQVRRVNLLRKR